MQGGVVAVFPQRPFLDYHNYVNAFGASGSSAACFERRMRWRDAVESSRLVSLDD